MECLDKVRKCSNYFEKTKSGKKTVDPDWDLAI